MNPHDIGIYLYNKDGSVRSKITECSLFSTDLLILEMDYIALALDYVSGPSSFSF